MYTSWPPIWAEPANFHWRTRRGGSAQLCHNQSERPGSGPACRSEALLLFSSACVYPEHNQLDPDNPVCSEDSAYPAAPDSEYGWEKLFSERLYFAYQRNYGVEVHVARFHNIFGPEGTWRGGREKAPAAICRKVSEETAGGKSKSGATANKRGRSFTSTSALKECAV